GGLLPPSSGLRSPHFFRSSRYGRARRSAGAFAPARCVTLPPAFVPLLFSVRRATAGRDAAPAHSRQRAASPFLRPSLASLVKRLNAISVPFEDVPPLHLERRGQHVVRRREVFRQEGEFPDALEALPVGGLLLQLVGEELLHARVLERVAVHSVLLGPRRERVAVGDEERDVERPVRAVHHRL